MTTRWLTAAAKLIRRAAREGWEPARLDTELREVRL
jgi:hypothetical protein